MKSIFTIELLKKMMLNAFYLLLAILLYYWIKDLMIAAVYAILIRNNALLETLDDRLNSKK